MIAIMMTVRIKPGKAKRFRALVEQLRRDVHANEPDTLVFEILQDAEDSNLFFFTEVFKDEAAREAHAEAPYHKAMSEEGWACVEGGPDIRMCHPIGTFTEKGEAH